MLAGWRLLSVVQDEKIASKTTAAARKRCVDPRWQVNRRRRTPER